MLHYLFGRRCKAPFTIRGKKEFRLSSFEDSIKSFNGFKIQIIYARNLVKTNLLFFEFFARVNVLFSAALNLQKTSKYKAPACSYSLLTPRYSDKIGHTSTYPDFMACGQSGLRGIRTVLVGPFSVRIGRS